MPNEKKNFRLLIVEDSEIDVELILRSLQRENFEINSLLVNEEEAFVAALSDFAPDLIISDYNLPTFNGMRALQLVKDLPQFIPFIIITGSIDEQTAVKCLKSGATDYVLKNNLARLPFAVLDALNNLELQRAQTKYVKRLEASEKKFRKLFHDNAVIRMIIDPETGKILEANSAAAEFYGWPIKTLEGMNISQINTMSQTEIAAAMQAARNNQQNYFEFQHRKANGEIAEVEVFSSLVELEGRSLLFSIIHDISEKKRALQELQASEMRFKALHDASFGGIFIHDAGKILVCNQSLAKMTGYSEEELIGMDAFHLVSETSRPLVRKNVEQAREEPYEAIGLRQDGSEYQALIHARNIPYQSRMVRAVEFHDITILKNREAELKESEERFKVLHNASFGGIAIHDKGKILDCNQGLAEISGYSVLELIGMDGLLLIAEAERDYVRSQIKNGYEKPYESIGVTKNGVTYPLRLEARNIPYQGKQVRVVEFRDLTEQKQAEEKVRESEEKFQLFAELAPVGIIISDLAGKPVFISPKFVELFGYPASEIDSLEAWLKRAYPDPEIREAASKRWQAEVEHVRKYGFARGSMEQPVVCKDGTVRQVEFHLGCSEQYNFIIFVDITERQQMQTQLQTAKTELENYFNYSLDLLVIATLEGEFLRLNPEWENILGYEIKELLGRNYLDFIHPEDLDATISKMKDLKEDKEVLNFENRYRHKDGSYRWIEWRSRKMGDTVYAVARDITERLHTLRRVKLNEARLESLLRINQYSPENIQKLLDFALAEIIKLTESKIGYIYYYDEKLQRFTLNTWSNEVMPQCSVTDKQTIYQLEKTGIWGEAVRQRKPIMINDFSQPNPLKKGLPQGHVPLKNFLTIPVFSKSKIVAVVGVANKAGDYNKSDIRQLNLMMDSVWKNVKRTAAEKRISSLLKEKEMLLKETHHRIKNNMAVVKSLLLMQANKQVNANCQNALLDAARRVQSMVTLYNKLYRSELPSQLNVRKFLPQLVKDIIAPFAAEPPVKTNLDIAELDLPAKTISSLAIIINECITNSMKYAFADNDNPQVLLQVDQQESLLKLRYADNGCGVENLDDLDSSKSFGMRLIKMMVNDLKGKLEIQNRAGLQLTITLPALTKTSEGGSNE
ncbi:MAG: PAS domain S-box protein [Candidatus Cloacimonadales bacterium]